MIPTQRPTLIRSFSNGELHSKFLGMVAETNDRVFPAVTTQRALWRHTFYPALELVWMAMEPS